MEGKRVRTIGVYPKDTRCEIEGCGRGVYAFNWCGMHYKRWRKHGDPTVYKGPVAPRVVDLSETELSWAAGLFEGEGSVMISPLTKQNHGHLHVDVPNVDPAIPAFFLERWGGKVTEYESDGRRRGYYRWRVYALRAEAFLRDVLPYLRTRRYVERVMLGLEYQGQKSRNTSVSRTDAYKSRQNEYHQRMAALNRRGV